MEDIPTKKGAIPLLDHLMLDTLRQIAHGLAAQFGSNCEVVVHDLDPDRLDMSPTASRGTAPATSCWRR